MNSIFTGDLIVRFLSLDRFQSDFRLQLCAVSLAYSWHPFPPFFASLDTAILSYRPVQDLGTSIKLTELKEEKKSLNAILTEVIESKDRGKLKSLRTQIREIEKKENEVVTSLK